jgi:hypothetical protein
MLTAVRFIFFNLVCCVLLVLLPRDVAAVQGTKNAQSKSVKRIVHISPPSANGSPYTYVPFDVPAHTARISISYQYERDNGANTIDIGLFDARSTGSDTDPRGFRGWSGGRRSEFFVSQIEATPGYLVGEMPAGTWRIILGLYRVAAKGVDVSLKIVIETDQNRSSRSGGGLKKNELSSDRTEIAVPDLKIVSKADAALSKKGAGPGARWWRGDLHMHTVHSDGDWTIAELVSSAKSSGLDFIFITDHNTTSHHSEIDRLRASSRELLVLRGEEITTYGGHANAWGLPSGTWIDFRVRPQDTARMSNLAREAHRAGALISINHPFATCGGCAWRYDATARDFDAIEVWNGTWDQTDEQALTMWDNILQSGRHMIAIASSDSHRRDTPIGQPTTHVAAKALSQKALLQAIRQGHVYLTDRAARPFISFEAEVATGKRGARSFIGDTLRLATPGVIRFFINSEAVPPDVTLSLISNSQVLRSFPPKIDGKPQVIEIEVRRDSYYRVEVRNNAKTVLALTNPIYLEVGPRR